MPPRSALPVQWRIIYPAESSHLFRVLLCNPVCIAPLSIIAKWRIVYPQVHSTIITVVKKKYSWLLQKTLLLYILASEYVDLVLAMNLLCPVLCKSTDCSKYCFCLRFKTFFSTAYVLEYRISIFTPSAHRHYLHISLHRVVSSLCRKPTRRIRPLLHRSSNLYACYIPQAKGDFS